MMTVKGACYVKLLFLHNKTISFLELHKIKCTKQNEMSAVGIGGNRDGQKKEWKE